MCCTWPIRREPKATRARDVALVLMDPDGGNRRIVAAFNGGQGSINVPCWAPGGTAFAFVRYAAPETA